MTFSTRTLGPGTHAIVAAFASDSPSFQNSVAAPFAVTVASPPRAAAIPASSAWSQALLAALVLLIAMRVLRRRPR